MAASTEALPDAAGPWEGGWHRFAPRLPSPNHGPRPVPGNPVDLIVLHSLSPPPGEVGGWGGGAVDGPGGGGVGGHGGAATVHQPAGPAGPSLLPKPARPAGLRAFFHHPQRPAATVRRLRSARLACRTVVLPWARPVQ